MIHLNRLHFLGSRPTGAGGHLLSFRPESGIRFTAGQHGLWLVPGGGAAPFSIASAPQDETIELGTVLHDANRTKSALSALQPGDTVRLLGPSDAWPRHPTDTPSSSSHRASGSPRAVDPAPASRRPPHTPAHWRAPLRRRDPSTRRPGLLSRRPRDVHRPTHRDHRFTA